MGHPKIWQMTLAAVVLLSVSSVKTEFTNYEDNYQLNCTKGNIFKRLVSFYYSGDRSWSISCNPLEPFINFNKCEWSNWVNNYNQIVLFECQNDAILTGIETVYSSSYDDRMYAFQCCEPDRDYVTHSCYYTGYVNNYQGNMNYRIPDRWYLRGIHMTSTYNNDRQFNFLLCTMDKIQPKNQC